MLFYKSNCRSEGPHMTDKNSPTYQTMSRRSCASISHSSSKLRLTPVLCSMTSRRVTWRVTQSSSNAAMLPGSSCASGVSHVGHSPLYTRISTLSENIEFIDISTLCLKKVHLFGDYSVKCSSILIMFSNIAAEKICKIMTYSFLIISSLCMNITE